MIVDQPLCLSLRLVLLSKTIQGSTLWEKTKYRKRTEKVQLYFLNGVVTRRDAAELGQFEF